MYLLKLVPCQHRAVTRNLAYDPRNVRTEPLESCSCQRLRSKRVNQWCIVGRSSTLTSYRSNETGNNRSPRLPLQALVAVIRSSQPDNRNVHFRTNASESSQLATCSGELQTTTPPLCRLPLTSCSAPLDRMLFENSFASSCRVAIARIMLYRNRGCGIVSITGSWAI